MKWINKKMESGDYSLLFIAEHWFPYEKYYMESRFYLCCSKFTERQPPFNKGLGGILVFISDGLRKFLSKVTFRYKHHIQLKFKNNLIITAVYWPRSMKIEIFNKMLEDIGDTDILFGDINFTLKELYKISDDEKIINLKKYMDTYNLYLKNEYNLLNKLDHIFIKTEYLDRFDYKYYKTSSDHPLVELILINEITKEKLNFKYLESTRINTGLLTNDTTQYILQEVIKIVLNKFESSIEYDLIRNDVDKYDESLIRILKNCLETVLGLKKTFKTKLSPESVKSMASLEDNIFRKFKLIKRLKVVNEIEPNSKESNVMADTVYYYKSIYNRVSLNEKEDRKL